MSRLRGRVDWCRLRLWFGFRFRLRVDRLWSRLRVDRCGNWLVSRWIIGRSRWIISRSNIGRSVSRSIGRCVTRVRCRIAAITAQR